jgi:hypothetical protein
VPASATLHGFCTTSDVGCADKGTNTPTVLDPPDFGFSVSPGPKTGDVWIDLLIPDTISNPSSRSFTMSGPLDGGTSGKATLVSATPWTSGQLDTYLGISASPTNPFGAFGAGGVTGYFVYQANLGSITLPKNGSQTNSDLLQLGQMIPIDSYIVGFQNQSGSWQATANSGAILETTAAGVIPEPATWAMMLLGFAGLGFAGYRASRNSAALAA